MKIGAHPIRCDYRPSAAFSITEVVMAVGLFAIVFLAAYSGIIQGTTLIQTTRENERATQILLDKAEILRLYTWDQLTNSSFTSLSFSDTYNPSAAATSTNASQGPTYYGTVTISAAPVTEIYSNDMRLLTFQVNWTNNDLAHQRQIITLVSRYGVHNYIFGP